MARAADDLTDKQRRFCEEYLVDLNATQAAIRAGYSAKTAEQMGYQLLQKTSVSETLSALRSAQSQRTAVTADRVIAGLLKEAEREGKGSMHVARVTAWMGLAKILGLMDKKVEDTTVNADQLSTMFQAMVRATAGSGAPSGATGVACKRGEAQHRRSGPSELQDRAGEA
jgi:phage terminase small subunit